MYTYIPPEPKDWVSLGSEKEIKEESVTENRRRVSVERQRPKHSIFKNLNFATKIFDWVTHSGIIFITTFFQIKVSVKRVRREFGAPYKFKDRNVADAKDGCIDCTSFDDRAFDLKKMELDKSIQVTRSLFLVCKGKLNTIITFETSEPIILIGKKPVKI